LYFFLLSLSTVTGIAIGMLLYSLLGGNLGANIGLIVGIAVITLSVYIINASHR